MVAADDYSSSKITIHEVINSTTHTGVLEIDLAFEESRTWVNICWPGR